MKPRSRVLDRAVLVVAGVVLVAAVGVGLFLAFVTGVSPFHHPHGSPEFNAPAAKPAEAVESPGGDCGRFNAYAVPKSPVMSAYDTGYKVAVLRGSVKCGGAETAIRTAYAAVTDFDAEFAVPPNWRCTVANPRANAVLPPRPIVCRTTTREVALLAQNP